MVETVDIAGQSVLKVVPEGLTYLGETAHARVSLQAPHLPISRQVAAISKIPELPKTTGPIALTIAAQRGGLRPRGAAFLQG